MNNKTLILWIAIISAALYLGASAFKCFSRSKRLGNVLWIAAIIGNSLLVGNNWVINGYVPFVSMYQVLTFLSLTFSLIYLYVKHFQGGEWMDKIFCFMPALCLIGVCFMGVGSQWHFPPALQSPYFVPHVLVYMIGYSLCAANVVLAVASFFKRQDRARLENGMYNLSATAFPFMTAGMFLGALWANEVWGSFWSFDAKENWSLITWLMLTLFLHFRRHKALKKYARIFVILCFIGVVVTMFFVNIMGGSSQHAYSA